MRLFSECDCPASVVALGAGMFTELIRTNIAYIEITFDKRGYPSAFTSSGITSQVALPPKGRVCFQNSHRAGNSASPRARSTPTKSCGARGVHLVVPEQLKFCRRWQPLREHLTYSGCAS